MVVSKNTAPDKSAITPTEFLLDRFGSAPENLYVLVWTLRKREGGKEEKVSHFLPINQLWRIDDIVVDAGDRNVYVGCGLSPKDFGTHKRCVADQIAGIAGIWADVDIKGPAHKSQSLPADAGQALEVANSLGLPPSEAVHSGHGIHAWWLFPEPWIFADDADRNRAASLSGRLLEALRRYATANAWELDGTADLARILRPPGTVNHKEGLEPVPVTMLRRGGPRYAVEDIEALLATLEEPEPVRNGQPGKPFTRTATGYSVSDWARKYVGRMPVAISGCGGHRATFAVAQVLIRGFDLSIDQARPIIEEYSSHCQPPWTAKDLEHKLKSAVDKSRRPRGYLLSRRREKPAASGHHATTGEPPAGDEPKREETKGFIFNPVDLVTLAATVKRPEMLVKRVLVRGQPMICGAPSKTLKTSVMCDMVVSLATGTKFLGEFNVYRPVRVALLSGESGDWTIFKTVERVRMARGLTREATVENLRLQFDLPQLGNILDMEALRCGLEALRIEVLVIDPLYLCLLAGSGRDGARAENMFEMGPLFLSVARTCLGTGCTPILVHHTKRAAAASREPLGLEDLAYSGVGEFARQWLLLSRRETFDPGNPGSNRLWMVAGGSVGHGGLWALDIEEGEIDDDLEGRVWETSVSTATESRETARSKKKKDRDDERLAEEREEESKVMLALDQIDRDRTGAGVERVRSLAGLSREKMNRAVARLMSANVIESVTAKVNFGAKSTKDAAGIRRRDN